MMGHKGYINHLTSPSHVGILSPHIVAGRVSTVRYFERDHIHITFITVYAIIILFYYIIGVNLLLCLTYKLSVNARYLCIGIHSIGSLLSKGFRHRAGHLGTLSPRDKWGGFYY